MKDRATGAALLAISVIIIVVYNIAMWVPSLSSAAARYLMMVTDSIIVTVVFAVLAWIGYTLLTTPPPKPIEEIEKELEKELKSLTPQGGSGQQPSASGQGK